MKARRTMARTTFSDMAKKYMDWSKANKRSWDRDKDSLKPLKKAFGGKLLADISVDQGGCVETMKVTTHSHPTYVIDGVVHYGVANMPGAVPRTSPTWHWAG